MDDEIQGHLEAPRLCRPEDGADAGPAVDCVCSAKTLDARARSRGRIHEDWTGRYLGQQGGGQHPDEYVRDECGLCERAFGGPRSHAGGAGGRLQRHH